GLPAQLVGPLGIITKGAATVDVALSFFQAGNAWIAYQENPSDNALYNAYLTAALKAIVQVSLAAALSAAGLEIGVIATAIVLAGQIVDLQNFHNILVALGVGYNPIASAFNWPALPTFRDPLVVNFEGDPLGFTSASNSPVYFDFTGSGSATETGWITSGEGLLLLNNGSSNISSEVLGAQSGSGFADLATLDTNGDGIISDQDASFGSLEVWFDQNGNGQIDPGEVKSLSDLGITGISLATNPVGGTVNGNIVVSRSQFSTATNGSSAGTVTEVDFATVATHELSVPPAGFVFAGEALLLPDLAGYGYVQDLRVAMTQDSSLLNNVLSLVDDAPVMSNLQFNIAFENLMLQWAGVSSVALDAYGADINSQHYAFICKLYGVTPAPQGDWAGIPNATIEAIYGSLIGQLEVRFSCQVALSELALGIPLSAIDPFVVLGLASYDLSSDTVSVD